MGVKIEFEFEHKQRGALTSNSGARLAAGIVVPDFRAGKEARLCIRPIDGRDDGSVAYGFLPPLFVAEIRRRVLMRDGAARSRQVRRTE